MRSRSPLARRRCFRQPLTRRLVLSLAIAAACGLVPVDHIGPLGPVGPTPAAAAPSHGIAMHGDLKYPPGFRQFDYVNPEAPKGGELKQATVGTFDSFNPFIVKGNPAAGVGQVYDTLMAPSADEPFSEYGLLAESIETPEDRSWVAFTLRPEAKWRDGKPVTVEDVIWSFETLRDKGQPFYRAYYGGVEKAEKTGPRTVKFTFKPGGNRELPLILGQLTVLPKHWWEKRDFEKTLLEAPMGSGAYEVEKFEPGRRIVYRRVADWWGKDLPVNRGRHNFDTIVIDYYRDETVQLEAFKSGEYDFRPENSAKAWATAYDFPAVATGAVKKETIPHKRPAGMQAFAFNLRRPIFQDPRVREALGLAFDFEWSNKNLFYNQYTRSRSYFDNSELAAQGGPSPDELVILEPLRGKVPNEVFTRAYAPPITDGSGNQRENLRKASELLTAAGWQIDPASKKLVNKETGKPFEFEVLLVTPLFERISLPWAKNLERLGVTAQVRTVDTAQYRRRLDEFDFDVVVANWGQSMSPGNEQKDYWTSEFATRNGSQNLLGLANPAVDALVEGLIAAPDRKSLVAHTRALDRVLQWNQLVVPQWHIPFDRIAYWDKLGKPGVTPMQGVQVDTWWIDPERAKSLDERKQRLRKN